MNIDSSRHLQLKALATDVLHEHGFLPEFSAEAIRQAAEATPAAASQGVRDLRELPWCSIDNDDSRDLDQLSVGEALSGGESRILVAIADVDSVVEAGSPVDEHAAHNTTSLYTAAGIFPMLPERLSMPARCAANASTRTGRAGADCETHYEREDSESKIRLPERDAGGKNADEHRRRRPAAPTRRSKSRSGKPRVTSRPAPQSIFAKDLSLRVLGAEKLDDRHHVVKYLGRTPAT